MGSVLTNKYSEGYPSFLGIGARKCDCEHCEAHHDSECKCEKCKDGNAGDNNCDDDCLCPSTCECKEWDEARIATDILPNYRYYGGQQNVDRIERLAIDRACRLFHADHANVQPHSGANANEAVYYAWCEPGDKILAMSLPAGGHLTHGSPVTRSAKVYNFISYGVTEDGEIDYDELERKALAEQPKIILVGYSAYMKIPDFARVARVAEKIPGCLLMADMAHVAGLIAGGVHPNPLDYGFHVMTTTTHKTLRGPRGGLILSRGRVASPLKRPEHALANIPVLIDRAVFPGTQGGPLEHIIAAKAVAFGEALRPEFHDYATKIVENAKALASDLMDRGFILQGGGTENHLVLTDVKSSFGIDGKLYERALDMVGLTLNANALPSDKQGAFRPSGVRLGTPAITTRGLGREEMARLADWMKKVAEICKEAGSEDALSDYSSELNAIHAEVKSLALDFPLPR
ncbi:serine hydroxymethyltransferase [Candidatus Saccharibacteria bacterium]|nr:serine hydroxymethyltransferase [Candidatus Saccharibacteria bacterium]